jgi:hypothetical protein
VNRSSWWFQERERREKGYQREGGRRVKYGGHGREKAKKHLLGECGRFGKSQQKLSLTQLPIFPHSFASAPSDLFPFLWLWRLLLSVPRAGPELGWELWGG